MLHIFIPEEQVKEPEQVMRMENAMLDKLAAIPGVTSVAFASGAPLEGFNNNDVFYAQDKDYAEGRFLPIRRFRYVTPGFFKTTGHGSDRRARLHLDRPLRKAARRDGLREPGERDVGRCARGAGQAGAGSSQAIRGAK